MKLYETHLPVSNLAASLAFYRDIVGLIPAHHQLERGVAFLWVDDVKTGMLGLWTPGSPWGWRTGENHRSHFAISIPLKELFEQRERLKKLGIEILGIDGKPSDELSVIGWMPSAQIYFKDPDGHLVEYISILDGKVSPAFFGTWPEWQQKMGGAVPSGPTISSA